jgi:hypothetical protein
MFKNLIRRHGVTEGQMAVNASIFLFTQQKQQVIFISHLIIGRHPAALKSYSADMVAQPTISRRQQIIGAARSACSASYVSAVIENSRTCDDHGSS